MVKQIVLHSCNRILPRNIKEPNYRYMQKYRIISKTLWKTQEYGKLPAEKNFLPLVPLLVSTKHPSNMVLITHVSGGLRTLPSPLKGLAYRTEEEFHKCMLNMSDRDEPGERN